VQERRSVIVPVSCVLIAETIRSALLKRYKVDHFRLLRLDPSITSVYQPTNAHIISHKTILKHFKTLQHVSILSDHHQGALFLAKVILQYSQFNSYLQTRCCGSISCCWECVVEQWLGVRRMLSNERLAMGCVEGYLLYSQVHRGG